MKLTPRVLVLVLSYNGKDLLDECLSSYLNNVYNNFEVIVIDNGSTDGTKEWVNAHYPKVYVLRTEINLKYSGGLNFGLQYAFNKLQADYVLITNNDVKADNKLISALVETAITNVNIGFVIGKVYYYDEPGIFQTVGKKEDPVLWNSGHIGKGQKDEGQFDTISERAFCDDIYWLVKRELYNITGGYDTEFAFQGEDFDWQVRAKREGYKIMYTPNAKLWHKESMTIGKSSPLKAYYDARNPLIVHMKYRTPEQFRVVFQLRFKEYLKISVKMIIKMRLVYLYKTWQGMGSAMIWGIRNNKLTLKHIL